MPMLSGRNRPDAGWRLRLWQAERAWRDLVPIIALAIAVYAVMHVEDKADKNTVRIEQQAEGRRVALDVLCGGLSGVAEGGRKALRGTLLGPPDPPPSHQEAQLRDAAARAYVRILSTAIIEQAGVEGKKVLRGDGSVDCELLKGQALRAERRDDG